MWKKKARDDVDEVIADIFGESDEEAEFEGFGEADIEAASTSQAAGAAQFADAVDDDLPSDLDEDEDDDSRRPVVDSSVSDFDRMMEKRRLQRERARRKRRKDVDHINDLDDMISQLKNDMVNAANEDRALNSEGKAATSKLRMLNPVMQILNKLDYQGALLDGGILGSMMEWLAPLPDKSLPHLQVRESVLKALASYPPLSSEQLRDSGIGKAVMYLYKHPRESQLNRQRAGKLIQAWARPIFNLATDYKTLSKEERQERDLDQLPKKRRLSDATSATPRRDIDRALTGEGRTLRPGDAGWVSRARVPRPSNKDYVYRPESNVPETQRPRAAGSGKERTRYEKHVLAFANAKKKMKNSRAINVNISGRGMT